MKSSELKKLGGFVPSTAVQVAVVWSRPVDGIEVDTPFTVGVIRPAFADMEKVLTLDAAESRSCQLISLCIRLGDNFDEKISYDQACRLESNLAAAFMVAIKSVNNLEETEKK